MDQGLVNSKGKLYAKLLQEAVTKSMVMYFHDLNIQ